MSKRTTLYNGNRWIRWVWLVVIVFQTIGLFSAPTQTDVLVLLIAILLFLLFWVLRRVNFDENNIYRIWGNKEKAVALTSVIRIERSGMKLNSRKYWRVRHQDKDGQEQKFVFLEGNFQHGSVKELIDAVRKVNPGVEVEESHIWNQVEQQKRRRAKRKARKEGEN